MLTGKKRASLRSQGQTLESILIVGKNGVTDNVVAEAENAFRTRELVKGRVLDSSPLTADEVCGTLAEKTHSEVVQTVGGRFLLYRENSELPEFKRAL